MNAAKVLTANGFAISMSEAKRNISQGIVTLNGKPVKNWADELQVNVGDILTCGKSEKCISQTEISE